MKKIISILITALIVSALLCACGKDVKSGSATLKPSATPGEVIPSNIPESGNSAAPGVFPSIMPDVSPNVKPDTGSTETEIPDADISAAPTATQ